MKENNNPLVDKKVEDLLKPRYKVIADYPDSEYNVGEIICNMITVQNSEWFDQYPHIFKKLEWWEERKESEMPDYVSFSYEGKTTIDKIVKWGMEYKFGFTDVINRRGCSLNCWNTGYGYQPATEQEYLNQ